MTDIPKTQKEVELPPLFSDEELLEILYEVFPSGTRLVSTSWKDGTYVDYPSVKYHEFVLRMTKPILDQLLQAKREIANLEDRIKTLDAVLGQQSASRDLWRERELKDQKAIAEARELFSDVSIECDEWYARRSQWLEEHKETAK